MECQNGADHRDLAILNAALNDLIRRPALYGARRDIVLVVRGAAGIRACRDLVAAACQTGGLLGKRRDLAPQPVTSAGNT